MSLPRLFCICLLNASLFAVGQQTHDPGLLFYLSGDRSFEADYAANGKPQPNFQSDVKIMPGGVKGSYMQSGDDQLLSYWAPGNVYAQRGTIAFDWRSREPVGPTQFPIFRVGYGDHSSWDMVWLRIDYNGHGFDAFVTDVNLGRTRISYTLPDFPKADQWTHLALAWDETTGIKFYVNGKMVAQKEATGAFDAALDQFGPNSRIIGPTGVESSYNYDRGGDMDELRIYDRALSDNNIEQLAKGETPQSIPPVPGATQPGELEKEWQLHYGWNRPGDIPTPLTSSTTVVRKVEIHDAYDLQRWWWKATDGIPETTWPGVYNRSRLIGRNDYFQLPDWDCYSLSGKVVTFFMPDEPWNHLEMTGGAFGTMSLLSYDQETSTDIDKTLFDRPKAQEKTFNTLATPITGQKIRFTNVEQETPISELSAYYVHSGTVPTGIAQLRYRLTTDSPAQNSSLHPLVSFIEGRYPEGQRATMVAMPADALIGLNTSAHRQHPSPDAKATPPANSMPIVHILIPSDFRDSQGAHGRATQDWENINAGLDGIAIDLPALHLKPTQGEYLPLNIQVKDPVWPMRNMFDFSFSVKPDEPHTLWLDLRDRILPNDKSLYLAIASSSMDFGPAALEGATIRLVFKPYDEAKKEHVLDRFTQVRDEYANLVEENTSTRKLNMFTRFDTDMTDLLRVDPQNDLGRKYWYDMNKEQTRPAFDPPKTPAGTPAWAFLQVRDLGYLKYILDWYIDKRQISNGEFGGGLSDDGDLTNMWPGAALMGIEPDKIKNSLLKELDAMYDQHMFTNGLITIQADELHTYEDGVNVLGQVMTLDFGSPRQVERAMVTSKRLEWVTGVNPAGDRLFRSSYYNGDKMATEGVWGWTKPYSYLVLHPAMTMVQYNGSPETRKMILDLADGLLAHRKPGPDGKYTIYSTINFQTNQDLPTGIDRLPFVFWAAYRWSGDKKYLQPFSDIGAQSLHLINSNAMDMLNVRDTWGKEALHAVQKNPTLALSPAGEANLHPAWQVSGNTGYLDTLYMSQIEAAEDRQYINTKGSLWIDRVQFNLVDLQRARLGGVAIVRNNYYPGHVASWKFDAPANDQSAALLIPDATPDHFHVIAYNLDPISVKVHMTGWEIDPGKWQISQSTQDNSLTGPLDKTTTRTEDFERSKTVDITLPPHQTTVLEFKLVEKGTPYWSRPDLGLDAQDVKVDGRKVTVTVHSIGAVDAPASHVILRDSAGRTLAQTEVPALKAPIDLQPKITTVTLTLPTAASIKGGSVEILPGGSLPEITTRNNRITLSQ
jgi:hypothetical protein